MPGNRIRNWTRKNPEPIKCRNCNRLVIPDPEDGACPKCHEPDIGSEQLRSRTTRERFPAKRPNKKAVGVIQANRAKTELQEIPRDDAERDLAFQIIRDFLTNEENTSPTAREY